MNYRLDIEVDEHPTDEALAALSDAINARFGYELARPPVVGNGSLAVARIDGVVVAAALVARAAAALVWLWVTPECRRAGIGTILLEQVKDRWGMPGRWLRYQAPITPAGTRWLSAVDPDWMARLVVPLDGHYELAQVEDASEAVLLGSGFAVPDDISELLP
jgi:GNAT superfamily N-acetyltransferase